MLPEQATSIPVLKAAFDRVRGNAGCAGADGMTINRFERDLGSNLAALQRELCEGKYLPLPLLKILVDKGNGEARALMVPSVRDRVAQTAVSAVVEPLFEAEFEACSFAYRKGRSVKQAVYQIQEYRDQGFRWVVEADIDAYFDSIDHELLLRKVKRLISDKKILRLIELWVKAEVWDGKTITLLHRGIPQGSAISPLLANLFLDALDEELMGKGFKLIRYADDFVILCKTPEKAKEALELTDEVLKRISLKLDEADIVSFDHGFKFLGVIFCRSMAMVPFDRPKEARKVLSMPPPLNMAAYRLHREKGWRWRIST